MGDHVVAVDGELSIRYATAGDADLLMRWWNDGTVMAHAGFPNGIGATREEVLERIRQVEEKGRRLIIELHDSAIGEMSVRRVDRFTAELGIKICLQTEQEKGYGTRCLKMVIEAITDEPGYRRVVLSTKRANTRAQHVYEKVGFRRTSETENAIKYELEVAGHDTSIERRSPLCS